MPYVPTNVNAYVAAFSGALAGIAVNGWIITPTEASYETSTEIAGAYAAAFDTAWASATELNLLEQQAITAACIQQFSTHSPPDTALAQLQSNWTVAATACVALIRESDTYFAAQAIVPPGLPIAPEITFGVRYVSLGATGSENGSPSNPFATLTAAMDSFTGPELAVGVVLIVGPGDYSGEADLDLPLTPAFSIQGIGNFNSAANNQMSVILPNVASYAGAQLSIERASIVDVTIAPGTGSFDGQSVIIQGTLALNGGACLLVSPATSYYVYGEGNITGANFGRFTSPIQFLHSIDAAGSITMYDTSFGSQATFQALTAYNCTFYQDGVSNLICTLFDFNGGFLYTPVVKTGTGNFFRIRDAEIGADLSCARTTASIFGSTFAAPCVFTFTGAAGTLTLDAISDATFVSSGSSIVNGVKVVL